MGSHITAPYYMWGLTHALYDSSCVALDAVWTFLLTNPRILFAFAEILLMFWSQVNLELLSIPRYIAESDVSKIWPLRVYRCFVGSFFLDRLKTLHLSGLYPIPYLS